MQVKTKKVLPTLKICDVFHIFTPKGGEEI